MWFKERSNNNENERSVFDPVKSAERKRSSLHNKAKETYSQTSFTKSLGGTTSGEELDAVLGQELTEFNEAGLIGDGQNSTLNLNKGLEGT